MERHRSGLFTSDEEMRKLANPGSSEYAQHHDNDGARTTALLTSVPEVELGLHARLQNIEATEKAKRELMQYRPHALKHQAPATDERVWRRFYQRHSR